jgi:hypothetical protein
MLQIPPPPDSATTHFFWIALPVIMTTTAGQVLAYLANKRRGDEKDIERQRAEARKEDRFAVLLENYNLHAHNEWKHEESTGALHAENIRFPRSRS